MWPFSRKTPVHWPPSDDWQIGDIARCVDDDWPVPGNVWQPKKGKTFRVFGINQGPAATNPMIHAQYLVVRPSDQHGWCDHSFVKENRPDEGMAALIRKAIGRPVREDA